MFKFELPREQASIIKVIGVGGGGSNAVNYMFRHQIKGVDFIVCNTDSQSLEMSPIPTKIQLGASLTQGLGAGAIPEVGRNAAIENIEDIKAILGQNTRMVFITAGMGGGTGTGAAPVIAQAAREMGILTVGIVTIPFGFEGKKRKQQAEEGLEFMRQAVDTLLVINNDKLREMYGNLTLANAFSQADEVLNTAARGIAEMISVTGLINVDFNDVNTVMRNSGVAIMGSASAAGENRARIAVEKALSSPLLNENHIYGAQYVLLNITYGTQEVTMDEIAEITDYIQEEAGSTADVIWGHGFDEMLGDSVSVTVIATGFNRTPDTGVAMKMPEKNKVILTEETPTAITAPIQSPTQRQTVSESVPEPYLKGGVEEVHAEISESSVALDEPVLKIMDPVNVTPVAENTVSETPITRHTLDTTSIEEITSSIEENVVFTSEKNADLPVSENPEWEITSSVEEETLQFEVRTEAPKTIDVSAETPQENVIRHWLDESEDVNDLKAKGPEMNSQQNTPETTGENKQQDVRSEIPSTKGQSTLFPVENVDPEKEKQLSSEEQQRRAQERLARIKELSSKLKSPAGLNDLENEPAYIRRKITLDKTQHSSESNISRFSVGGDGKDESGNGGGLRSNNSFLHDNVD
ncbi:MAG TPA: cell division protein FtsZ [Flavobacteriales bacterium]|nr:cell division protein FtsZ [Flavobacteriales bacterium]HRE95382.1 cell division protein FtsZ [Flavobacteriales bacterium]HRJ38104.1 cell division protein FtsZ [Flavobacteriales bacterium]